MIIVFMCALLYFLHLECNNIDYLFLQHGFNSPAYSTSDGVTTLVIYARKFRYPVVTEYPTLGWAEFLASFGGSIGFYIGGSILAFIHVPLYLLHMGVFYFRKWAGLCRNSAQPSQPIQVPPGRVTYSSTSNPTGISVY